ncbi:hypothetical protein [Salarchaeum japonicum]|uniref:CBM11 domain-containing protein n=1 Tax=Salarchaeum japonicum TaxID=555573 RepID=A0AAV3T3F6_9EURY|nr:hypothetical protein [Salarchaeum japonicum]
MERRALLALGGSALATTLAGCSSLGDADSTTPRGSTTNSEQTTPRTPSASLRNGSFESDWQGWTVGRRLPDDPNEPGTRPVASEAGVSTRYASDGETSLRVFIDGSQDDGTVWVEQPVDLSQYDYLAVDYQVSTSFNEILQAAVYTGPEPESGLEERQFDRSHSLAGHDAAGWKTFVYDVTHDADGIVAVGFNIVWETGAVGFLDNVRLTNATPTTVSPTTTPTTESSGTRSETSMERTR